VMRGEKWAIYAILSLVLLIASFNMIGALSMLVLEKQKDIAILKAMGALPGDIRAVFILEGILWALMGGLAGILLGYGICLIQQRYGIITVGGSFLMDAFPVDMQLGDLLLVLATISAVGLLAAWYPAVRATRVPVPSLKGA
jgi:lipoprotein-releasing system permease protein